MSNDAQIGYLSRELALHIKGMTCASCAAHVEGALADVPGVVSVAVNLSTGRAIVTYIDGAVAQPDLERAVRETGYRVSPPDPSPTTSDRFTLWFSRRWLLVFGLSYGLFVGLPFLAPVFMRIGWETPGRAVYFIYSFFCHQLPQRSFFLFGPQGMYDLSTIQAAWDNTLNPLLLRQFVGNPEMGWKVAWSDRMVSMYGSILVFGWLWYPLRKRFKTLPLWGFVLLSLPIVLDGSTHFLSDMAGIGRGFRDSNAWLADLTGDAFRSAFYAGDTLGSFNSWMRLVTGTLFGLGIVWYGFPYIEQTARLARTKVERTIQLSQFLAGREHAARDDFQT